MTACCYTQITQNHSYCCQWLQSHSLAGWANTGYQDCSLTTVLQFSHFSASFLQYTKHSITWFMFIYINKNRFMKLCRRFTQTSLEQDKKTPERLTTATLPRSFILKASFPSCFTISSVHAACLLVLLKPAPLCARVPTIQPRQTLQPVCRETNAFFMCQPENFS